MHPHTGRGKGGSCVLTQDGKGEKATYGKGRSVLPISGGVKKNDSYYYEQLKKRDAPEYIIVANKSVLTYNTASPFEGKLNCNKKVWNQEETKPNGLKIALMGT